MSRSALTSWPIRAMGKSGARSSGPIGWPVPGFRTGGGGAGRSAAMLYQDRGIRSSERRNFTDSPMATTLVCGFIGFSVPVSSAIAHIPCGRAGSMHFVGKKPAPPDGDAGFLFQFPPFSRRLRCARRQNAAPPGLPATRGPTCVHWNGLLRSFSEWSWVTILPPG